MIGYYIHHQGHGHRARAEAVARACDEQVVALSSLPPAAGHHFADWLELAGDPALADPDGAGAGGALHWSPVDSPGYRRRMRQLADWVTTAGPRLVVVDVSVEVTALIRLLGVPVVVVAGSGARTDDAHTLALRMASRVIAPWPRDVLAPRYLAPFADTTIHVGAFSRFDDRVPDRVAGRRRVLVLGGGGGSTFSTAHLAAMKRAAPDWQWRAAGGAMTWNDDLWHDLMCADVVVTHAGMNALAEIAAARLPCIVVPEPRPFAEQVCTAAALDAAGLATVVHDRSAVDWPRELAAAQARGGAGWVRWNDGRGAARFAHALATTATGGPDG